MEAIQVYNKFQTLADAIGYEELAKEMYYGLNKDKANELFDFIAKNHEVELNNN